MGLIQAVKGAVTGSLADQWKEAICCPQMDNRTLLRKGTKMNAGAGSNTKGNPDIITAGSTILVEEEVCMLTIDNGKITNIVTEPGAYTFDNSSAPSIFAGQILPALKDTLQRFMYGGVASTQQRVVYINLMKIPGLPFGTGTPFPYPDPRYNTTLDLRFYGTFEIEIPDAEGACKFYREVASKGAQAGDISAESVFKNEQYKKEFMQAMETALVMLSTEGASYNQFAMFKPKLTNDVAQAVSFNWAPRGFGITAVGMGPVTLSQESKDLLGDRLKADTMLGGDVQRAMMAGSVARGIEAAGSNEGGAMMGFMGVNMGMNAGGGILGQMSGPNDAYNQQQPQYMQNAAYNPMAGMNQNQPAPAQMGQQPAPVAGSWICVCGKSNTGKFCADCGKQKPEAATSSWTCVCGTSNTGKFCANCGTQKPETSDWTCSCGKLNTGKFCADCGKQR